MIEILKNYCIGCGKCARVCPYGIIKMTDGKAFVSDELNKSCLNCGHCQSICDCNAILLNDQPTVEINAQYNINYEDLKRLMQTNRSIRFFKDDLVPQEKIQDILSVTDYTASAKNQQTMKYVVVSSKEKVQEVSDLSVKFIKETGISPEVLVTMENIRNPITTDAPHLLIAYADDTTTLGSIDGTIKIAFTSLLMHSDGIGSCYLGYLTNFINASAELRAHLGIADNQKVFCALAFGYNDNEVYKNIPHRKQAEARFL